MEELLQTDTISDYKNNENAGLDASGDNENAATIINGCDEIDDLMDNCDNQSIASNSDVWNGSDTEDENVENKDNSAESGQAKSKGESNNQGVNRLDESKKVDKDETDAGGGKEKSVIESEDSSKETQNVTNEESLAKKNVAVNEEKNDAVVEKVDAVDLVSESNENKKLVKEVESSINELETFINEVKDSDKEDVPNSEIVKNKEEASDVVDSEKKDSNNADEKESLPVNVSNSPNRQPSRTENVDEDCQMEYDAADDDDFDPSLLCPEVSMDVDDSVVVTNGSLPNDADGTNPLPCSFLDEVTGAAISFNLTDEEHELRRRLYGPTNPIQYTRMHCTACNIHLGSALKDQNKRFVHPLLKALICKQCYHFYTSGEFDKDEDGSELYCRWCGQGGQVLCCSKCEYVFCKRCIRTNFGRKKMFEIRDSDSWDCFRCNPSQIITQRVACYEFFEFVRRELSRDPTDRTPNVWDVDHSRCCLSKKRQLKSEDQSKAKKKKDDVDPDYNPFTEKTEAQLGTQPSTSAVLNPAIMGNRPLQLVSTYKVAMPKDNDIEFVRQIPAPSVSLNPLPRPQYRTILPSLSAIQGSIKTTMAPPALVRISSQPVTAVVSANRILSNALQNKNVNSNPIMKHEWFEKTVRAAARVNSHLSYTLTQLNKAQSQAASVEELAVVHNKLQEILSSSINSLIQIRKNLRTEFISGIKTVRLPSKKNETYSNDDDVIFVSAPTVMPMPSTSFVAPTVGKDPLIIIDKSNTMATIGSVRITTVSSNNVKTASNDAGKNYLKVKSLNDLQKVTSECITIPDDAVSNNDDDKDVAKTSSDVVCNGESSKKTEPLSVKTDAHKDIEIVHETDPLALSPSDFKKPEEEKSSEVNDKNKAEKTSNVDGKLTVSLGDGIDKSDNNVKRMMSVTVKLQRDDLQELQKKYLVQI